MTNENPYDPEQIGNVYRRTAWECENCRTRISWRFSFKPTKCPYCEETGSFRRFE